MSAQGAVVRRPRSRGVARRSRRRAGAGRGSRARAAWRHQPRHRSAGVRRAACPQSEYERMRAPFQEGDVPVPGQIRLCRRSASVEAGPAELAGRTVFACIRTRTRFALARRCGRAVARRRAALARRARRQHGDGAQRASGTARPARPTASPWSAPASSARSSRICAGGCRAAEVTLDRHRSGARARWPARWASSSRAPDAAPQGLRPRVSCERRAERPRHRARPRRR